MRYDTYDDDWYPHDKSYKPTPAFAEDVVMTDQERLEWKGRYERLEKELFEYDVVTKITNFTEWEHALQQLNKLRYEH